MSQLQNDTFIVETVRTLLRAAKKFSFHHWTFKLIPDSFLAIDVWVIAWLSAAVLSYVASLCIASVWPAYVIGAVSAIRVFECFTYICYVMLFPEPNKGEYGLRSYRRSTILLILNYAEIIFWFATWYSLFKTHGRLTVDEPAAISIIRESLAFMVANSTGAFRDMRPAVWITVTIQNFLGLFLTVVVVSRFVALLPRPQSGDPEERD